MMDFDDFTRATYADVLRTVTLALGTVELAEDVTQEAYAKAGVRWEHVASMDRPAGWICVVAINAVVATALVVVAGLAVGLGRPTSSTVHTASHGDPFGVSSPTTDPGVPGKIPSWSDIPPAPYPAPSADHYYKALVVLTPDGNADASPSAIDLRVVAGFVADGGLVDRVARQLDRSPTWVSRRITADVDLDRHTLDVIAIDTDPEATVSLAVATAQALTHLASSPTAETYAAERQRVEVRRTWLIDQRQQLEASDQPGFAYLTVKISELDDVLTALAGTPKSWPLSMTHSGGPVEINGSGFQMRWNTIAANAD